MAGVLRNEKAYKNLKPLIISGQAVVRNLIGVNPEELTNSKRGLNLARFVGTVEFIWFNTVQVKYDAGAKTDKTVTAAAGTTNPGRRDPPG